jgi:hypothetical protein
MQLGTFSISLSVKDLHASRKFYEHFGFKVFAGDAAQNWLILKNGEHAIGLFQGMFEKNMLTFNPGWDGNAQKLASFTDVRELQRLRLPVSALSPPGRTAAATLLEGPSARVERPLPGRPHRAGESASARSSRPSQGAVPDGVAVLRVVWTR